MAMGNYYLHTKSLQNKTYMLTSVFIPELYQIP